MAAGRISRSTLFAPAARPDMVRKAAASAADAVCLDLEDSVAAAEKPAARASAAVLLRELDFGRRARVLRINALDTPFAYRDLVDVVEAAGEHLDRVMLPKASEAADVRFVDTLLTQIELARGLEPGRIGIEAQIETARGCLNVAQIASASPRLAGLIFGPGDFAASARMPSASIGEADEHDALYPGHRWHFVMQSIVVAARASGLRCTDGPFAAFRDAAGLERSARVARALGFDGKQCIHPAQLEVVNRVFAPSEAEVAWARQVAAAMREAEAAGRGAARVGDRMVDAASTRMAETILGLVDDDETGGHP